MTLRPYAGGTKFNALVFAFIDMARRIEKDPSTAHEEARVLMQQIEDSTFCPLIFRQLIESSETRLWVLILLATKTEDPRCMEELISSFATAGHADLLVRHLVRMNPGIVLVDLDEVAPNFTALVEMTGPLEKARWYKATGNPKHWLHNLGTAA